MSAPVIVWFRRDLRLEDNSALSAALRCHAPVIPIYIHDAGQRDWAEGGASRWWLHHALKDLDEQLKALGGQLNILCGKPVEVLSACIKESGAQAVYFNARYEPEERASEAEVCRALKESRVEIELFCSSLLFQPGEVLNKTGKPYKVFTPFWKTLQQMQVPAVVDVPLKGAVFRSLKNAHSVDELSLLPDIPWDRGFYKTWEPTRKGAIEELKSFIKERAQGYPKMRDYPSVIGTSRMSPSLHFGQIGPREIWARTGGLEKASAGGRAFLREVAWREFAYHLLVHFSHTPHEPLQEAFKKFPWEENPEALRLWQRGQTGYPIVDAGMRELWQTGWMHNRVRMIVASFLVKDLRISWLAGAQWFWDTLVDADLANNTLGWQWAGGCGADAAPYFRVFNPMLQGAKFDASGEYVRRYCPELSALPDEFIHAPREAPDAVLKKAGIVLGENYPEPMVDHKQARQKALHAYEKLKSLTSGKS